MLEMTAHALYKNAILGRAKFMPGFALEDHFRKRGWGLWEYFVWLQMVS